jgi:hypothetical protein
MILLLRWAIDEDLFHAHSLYLGHMDQDFCRLRQSEAEVSFCPQTQLFIVSVFALVSSRYPLFWCLLFVFLIHSTLYSISFFVVPDSLPI